MRISFDNLLDYGAIAIALLYTIISHECAHGIVAGWNGDSTAKDEGRITLNPIPHLDILGALSLLLFHFGWAKPVPINPRKFRHLRRGLFTVSLAGVTINFLSAAAALWISKFVPPSSRFFQPLLSYIVIYGVSFAVFNLLPIPPLDGSKVVMSFLPQSFWDPIDRAEKLTIWILPILVFTGFLGKILGPLFQRALSLLFHLIY